MNIVVVLGSALFSLLYMMAEMFDVSNPGKLSPEDLSSRLRSIFARTWFQVFFGAGLQPDVGSTAAKLESTMRSHPNGSGQVDVACSRSREH